MKPRRRLVPILSGALAACGLALWLIPSQLSARANPVIPPQLDILSANVEEIPPIDPTNVPGRTVVFSIEVAGAPVCSSATGLAWYGFLIDADKSHDTGVTTPAFEDLGVDAQVVARCNPSAGGFFSAMGPVSVTAEASGATLVEIRTTAAMLPSVDFNWVAFAENSSTFIRLPHEPAHGSWTTTERSTF